MLHYVEDQPLGREDYFDEVDNYEAAPVPYQWNPHVPSELVQTDTRIQNKKDETGPAGSEQDGLKVLLPAAEVHSASFAGGTHN